MKLLLVYTCLLPLFVYHACTSGRGSPVAATEKKIFTKTDTVHFKGQVQPILEQRCSPCHFTGGKMYEKMPFDQDTTLINHQASILKRIKDIGENEVIRKFIRQNGDKLK